MGTLRKWSIPVLLLLGIGALVWYNVRQRRKFETDHMLIELRAIQVQGGWGYDIWYDHRLFIHQNIIPEIRGKHVFSSKEDALAVGQIVYKKVLAKQVPEVTEEELRKLNISLPDSAFSK